MSFELGRWDDWMEESQSELPAEGADFYRIWFEGNAADRLAYRGGADAAMRVVQRALESDAVRESGQAQASLASQMGDVLMAQQRWEEAMEATRAGWNHSDMARYATMVAMLAATAAGDSKHLEEAHRAQDRSVEGPDLPAPMANEQIAIAFGALLDERWDVARAAYLNAKRLLEQVGNRLLLARVQLAVGHLAAEQFPEAADAAREADAFFHERGADEYVAGYRAHAAHGNRLAPAASTSRKPAPSKSSATRAS